MTRSPPPGHRPGRKGHRILERLSVGPATMADLRSAAGVAPSSAAGRKLWRLVGSMVRDELIARDAGLYVLGPAGADALADLRDEIAVLIGPEAPDAAPSIRIFERRAA